MSKIPNGQRKMSCKSVTFRFMSVFLPRWLQLSFLTHRDVTKVLVGLTSNTQKPNIILLNHLAHLPKLVLTCLVYPPASEASREVENFDWRKKHTPTLILCQKFVCLSVCLSVRFLTLNISELAKQKGLKIFLWHPCQKVMSQKIFFFTAAGR